MPYLQANTNTPFGFAPADGSFGRAVTAGYVVSSSFGSNVFAGDLMVVTSSAGYVIPYGGVGTSGASNVIGVAAHFLPTVTAGTTGQITAGAVQAANLLIYNDPDQLFVVQDNGSTALTGLVIGNVIDVSASGAGSTTLGRSKMQLATSAVGNAASSFGAMKVVGLHPIEQGFGSSTGGTQIQQRKWLVKINRHSLDAPGVGVTA